MQWLDKPKRTARSVDSPKVDGPLRKRRDDSEVGTKGCNMDSKYKDKVKDNTFHYTFKGTDL